MPRKSDLDPAVFEQAAEWFAVLNDPAVTAAEQARWQVWVQSHPAHRRAWSRVEEIERKFRGLPPKAAHAALAATGRRRRQFLKSAIGLAVAAPALWVAWRFAPIAEWQADYRTAVGETRKYILADGTRLWLNTDSAVNVQYGPAQRRLELVAGEIAIETAPDNQPKPRPLVVRTTAGLVQPLGTHFGVRDHGNKVSVQVFTGRVTLQPAADADNEAMLHAGQQTVFTATEVQATATLEASEPAWTRGVLIADNMRLDDFLQELGRYRYGHLGCAPGVAGLRLVGAYPLENTDLVLAALEETLPVTITRRTPWWVHVKGR